MDHPQAQDLRELAADLGDLPGSGDAIRDVMRLHLLDDDEIEQRIGELIRLGELDERDGHLTLTDLGQSHVTPTLAGTLRAQATQIRRATWSDSRQITL